MSQPPPSPLTDPDAALRAAVAEYWGFRTFRPLQEESMRAVLDGRDSLTVMPTGGGKSLCYQAPALVRGGVTVVVSPLIALMKDQVDSLRANGVAAAQLDSSLSAGERRQAEDELRAGWTRLLFCSPERLVMGSFQDFLRRLEVQRFIIDEAHCISHWGHDFRPEYRQLGQLKTLFPGCSVHGFTATATEQVRSDICTQLNLSDPLLLVGNFDRPNLTYRIVARQNADAQIDEVLGRHQDEAGIIYCLRRKDVDELTQKLIHKGHAARPYHAGLTTEQRRKAQEAFRNEDCNLIVATVAFGMGIDRSNIRFVLHAAMPKSIEAYQQETGRAGRDSLDAECVLLYSARDGILWKSIIERSAAEAAAEGTLDPSYVPNALAHIDAMDRYCRGAQCRHRGLVEHFGQAFEKDNCGACDLCLDETEMLPDALVVAQKILSCVARVQQRFGIGHVLHVLRGSANERVQRFGHDQLPTFGLLQELSEKQLRDLIYQLIGQKVLVQSGEEYPVLKLNQASVEVMRGTRTVRLTAPTKSEKVRKGTRADAVSWEGVDAALFEALRVERRKLAIERSVPPYVVFSDATLRDLARVRPSSLERMRGIYGIGETKLRDFGKAMLAVIAAHCKAGSLAMDTSTKTPLLPRPVMPRAVAANASTASRRQAFDMFERGTPLEDVSQQTGRTLNTANQYLVEWIQQRRPETVTPWVAQATYDRVAQAVEQVGGQRLRPVFDALEQSVPYDLIRIVMAHLEVR